MICRDEREVLKNRMKRTTTEIFIEVEETIEVKSARRRQPAAEEAEAKPVIEICPHCHRAICEPTTAELEGDSER